MNVEIPDRSEMEIPSMEEAFEDRVATKPLPPEHEFDEAECHNCGESFDEDEWPVRHINPPQSVMESWLYKCHSCKEEVFEADI